MTPACYGHYALHADQPCVTCQKRSPCAANTNALGFTPLSHPRYGDDVEAPDLPDTVGMPLFETLVKAKGKGFTVRGRVVGVSGKPLARVTLENGRLAVVFANMPVSRLYDCPSAAGTDIRPVDNGAMALCSGPDAAVGLMSYFAKEIFK